MNHFNGKTVLCNCDDDEKSEFFKYFQKLFEVLGLKKLIGVHYESEEGKPSYKLELYKDTNNDGQVTWKDKVIKTPIYGDDKYSAGDFRSKDCIELLKEADIVVTNPPFSLWRKFLAQLIKYDKKFLIIGNSIHVSKKEVFSLIKSNKIWLGISIRSGNQEFRIPSNYDVSISTINRLSDRNVRYIKIGGIRWFTNLKTGYKQPFLQLSGNYYEPDRYPKYDNYLGVNVNRTADIPCDYPYIMGVPLSFVDKYCPEQFKILGITDSTSVSGYLRTVKYVNPVLRRNDGTTANGNVINLSGPCIKLKKLSDAEVYYTADNCDYKLKHLYDRILIKNKNPQWSKYRYKKIINYYLPEDYIPALTANGTAIYNQKTLHFKEKEIDWEHVRAKNIPGTDIYYHEEKCNYSFDNTYDLNSINTYSRYSKAINKR